MNSFATPPELPRDEAVASLDASDQKVRIDGLLSLALYDPDWRLVQGICLTLLDDPDQDVRATAVLGLAHLARLHGDLDLDRVMPELRRLQSTPALSGRVEDALDDIETFIVRRQQGSR